MKVIIKQQINMNRKEQREGAVSTTYSQQKQRRLSTDKLQLPSRKETQSVDTTQKKYICTESPLRSNNPHMATNQPLSIDDFYGDDDNTLTLNNQHQNDCHQYYFRPIQPSRSSHEQRQLTPSSFDEK